MFSPLSVAAACSSKLNPRQKRLRSASPHALLIRPPNGACRINCMPPPSSKNLSATIVVTDGTVPSTARPAATYPIICSAAQSSTAHSSFNHATVPATEEFAWLMYPGTTSFVRPSISSRNSDTNSDNSIVRCGASPVQKGTDGGCPCASSTSTRPLFDSTL